MLLGIACLFVLTDKPAQAAWLAPEQREWLTGRMEAEAAVRKPVGHLSLWQLATNKYFLVMALVCSGASATGSVLSVWQPQLLKSFGLTNLQTGFINAIPYGFATVLMVLWGRHSDSTGERRWHTAIPLLLAAGGFTALGLTGTAIVPTLIMVTCCLVGAYAFKGPFWALSASWLSARHACGGPGRDQRDLEPDRGRVDGERGRGREAADGQLRARDAAAGAALRRGRDQRPHPRAQRGARGGRGDGEAMTARPGPAVGGHEAARRSRGMAAFGAGLSRAVAAGAEQAVPNSAGSAPPRLDAPADACDCHHHIYDGRFPVSPHWHQGFPPGATVSDYRLLQRRLGTTRSVVVQPSTYGVDNRCLVDALGQLGPASRGVAVVDTEVQDSELRALTDGRRPRDPGQFRFSSDLGHDHAGDASLARRRVSPLRLARADPDDRRSDRCARGRHPGVADPGGHRSPRAHPGAGRPPASWLRRGAPLAGHAAGPGSN